MADYVGGFDTYLLNLAKNIDDKSAKSIKMELDRQEGIKKRAAATEIAQMKLDPKKLTDAKIAYYTSEANKNDSQYMNTSYGVFDTKTKKYIDIPANFKQKPNAKVDDPVWTDTSGNIYNSKQEMSDALSNNRKSIKNKKYETKITAKDFDNMVDDYFNN